MGDGMGQEGQVFGMGLEGQDPLVFKMWYFAIDILLLFTKKYISLRSGVGKMKFLHSCLPRKNVLATPGKKLFHNILFSSCRELANIRKQLYKDSGKI